MSLGQGQAHEAHFGPPSELINLSEFLQSAKRLEEFRDIQALSQQLISSTSNEPIQSDAIAAECSVEDLKASLVDVIQDPRLMAHITRHHEATVHAIYENAEMPSRRRKRITIVDPAQEHPDATALQAKLDASKLKSWPLTLHAASFIRPPKHSDHNTLKELSMGADTSQSVQALLFVTVFTKLTWGQRALSRSSQHVLISSESLGDFFEAIPCPSNELPREYILDTGELKYDLPLGGEKPALEGSSGCALCIEDVAYGDGQTEYDYSSRLLRLLEMHPAGRSRILRQGPPMHDTLLSSLSIRLHTPYWLVHEGNCEHYFVFDQIRLRYSSDPPVSSYPLTTQITPPLLDLCRACNKVPAVYSIIGDIRLGESPFLICRPCWRWMGEPKEDGVVVVPLSRHELGWGG